MRFPHYNKGKIRMNKQKKTIGIIILLSVIGLMVLANNGFFSQLAISGYESVYKANYGHICCEEGAYEPKFIRWCDDYPLYKCDAYTDECRVIIHPAEDLGLAGKSVNYQICDLNGNSCTTENRISFAGYSETTDQKLLYVPYGKSIKFSPLSFPNGGDWGYIKFEADYRRFYIQGEENGRIFVQNSCILNQDLKQRVLSGGLNELSKSGINRCQNYITDYILVDTKTYSYLGRDVLCQARNLYEIDSISLLDGSSKKIQGERIKSVECCPTEANCDSDTFTFKEDTIKECTYDYECPNAGEPVSITGTSYVTFGCDNGICKQSNPITVECTNNAICVNNYNKPNMVCKEFKCVEDADWLGHCGDNKCENIIGETPTSCPEDCGNYQSKCEWYDLTCKSFLDIVKYLLVLISTLFSFIYSRQFLDKLFKKNNKETKTIKLVIAISLAFLVGYILYTLLSSIYFWVGLGVVFILSFMVRISPQRKLIKMFKR